MPQSCLNCNQKLVADAQHCNHCGQKIKIQHLSFWSIVSDFFSNLFNIETKIWRTFRDIWKPAKLTQAFISGKRVSYYNPIRIFIITLFTFFTLYLFNIRSTFQNLDETITAKQHEVWKIDLAERYDSLAISHNWPEELSDTIKKRLFTENIVIDTIPKDSIQSDTIDISESISTDNHVNTNITYNSGDNLINFSLGDADITDSITINDLFRLSEQELREASVGNSWLNTQLLVQLHKVVSNLSSSIQFLIGNGTWLIIAVILLLSGFFKILYWRHPYLYAEHFIFHVYGHTRLLILAIIGLLAEMLILDKTRWLIPWFIVSVIFLYLGMLRFYRQSIMKTLVKASITMFVYMFLIAFCFMLVFGLSFFFF